MKPYQADKSAGRLKFFKAKISHWMNKATITKSSKLEAKNANRSHKKAARQQGKKELQNIEQ